MGCIRFIHFSDLHLGRSLPFLRIKNDYELFSNIFEEINSFADRFDIDFFVLSGDIFNSTIIDYRFKFLFINFLEKNRNRRVYLLPGNHDPYDAKFYSFFQEYKNLVVFDDKEEVKFYDEGGLCVAGINLDFSNKKVNPLKKFDKKLFDKPTVFLMHSNFSGLINDHENYFPIGFNDLEDIDVPFYLAMGHIHQFYLKKNDLVTVSYPGSPLPVRVNETGDRSFNLVEFDNNSFNIQRINTAISIREKIVDIDESYNIEDVYSELSKSVMDNLYYLIIVKGLANENFKSEFTFAKKDLMEEFPGIVDIRDESITAFEMKDIKKRDIFHKLLYEESEKDIKVFDNSLNKIIKKYNIELDYEKIKMNALSYIFANLSEKIDED